MISIHVPTRGTTDPNNEFDEEYFISIHVPTRGTTRIRRDSNPDQIFQSTSPRGGRQLRRIPGLLQINISIHVPTRGTTYGAGVRPGRQLYFNPRPHEGDDWPDWCAGEPQRNFNPRPHEGDDEQAEEYLREDIISIHVPTRGTTSLTRSSGTLTWISIHVPTRGTTAYEAYKILYPVISIHVPTRGTTRAAAVTASMSTFQSTSPRGGRPTASQMFHVPIEFQSTSPRGGRPIGSAGTRTRIRYFNPRPHEGDDWPSCCSDSQYVYISIHVPTRGTTLRHLGRTKTA